jgi:phenol 2-monooxygenase
MVAGRPTYFQGVQLSGSVYFCVCNTISGVKTDKASIFLAGDAVHTHSPTMGQGMNVSMQDAYNLGWKLGSVLSGISDPSILSTYSSERRPVAIELLELDKKVSEFYTKGASDASRAYQSFRDQFSRFSSGVSVTYGPSSVVADSIAIDSTSKGRIDSTQPPGHSVATGMTLGQRMPSYKVVRQADLRVVQFSEALASNGRWRIVVFAGDLTSSRLRVVQDLGVALDELVRGYKGLGDIRGSSIEVILLHSGARASMNLLDPKDDRHYGQIFSDDACQFEPCGSAYEEYGVSKEHGCLVVLRPDQHVSCLGPLEDVGSVRSFFTDFMRSAAR